MLKAALASGEVRCIGVATQDDYRNHIERDASLERRLQPACGGSNFMAFHHVVVLNRIPIDGPRGPQFSVAIAS